MIRRSKKYEKEEYDYDVVIIGAGLGGLTAGNLLAKKGRRVLILEKHFTPGGYCTNFQRKEYTFDVSIQMINGCEKGGMIYNTLKKFGAENTVDFIKIDNLVNWYDKKEDFHIEISSDIKKFIQNLTVQFPHEKEGICDCYYDIIKIARFIMRWDKAGMKEKAGLFFKKFRTFTKFLRIINKTVDEFIRKYVSEPELIDIMTGLGRFFGCKPEEMNAFMFIVGAHAFFVDGAYYPQGGGGHFSQTLADIFTKNGGVLKLSSEVVKLSTKNEKITEIIYLNKKGEHKRVSARAIISNADVTELITDLTPQESLPSNYVENIKRREPGTSAVVVYLGLNYDLAKAGFTDHQYWTSKRFGFSPKKQNEYVSANGYDGVGGNVITIYSNIDPSCCRKGKAVISSLFHATIEPFQEAIEQDGGKRGKHYKALKERIGQKQIAHLSRVFGIPDLANYVEVIEVATPITFKRYTNNREGAIMGWTMTNEQMVLHQVKQETPLQNLFLAGAWTFPAAGISAVISSGDKCSELIEGYLKSKI